MTTLPPNQKQSGSFPIPRWVWVAAALLLLLGAYTTWQTQHQIRELSGLERRTRQEEQRSRALGSEQQRYQQALNIVAAAGTRQTQLKPAQPNMPVVSAYWNPQMGLLVTADNLPQLSSDRTLQLWILPATGAPISAALLRPNGSGQLFSVLPPTPSIGSAKSLAISEEPAGGSSRPTSAWAWMGPLS